MHRDNKVRHRLPDVVRGFAHDWRGKADGAIAASISIVKFLENSMPKNLHKKVIRISIEENLKDNLNAYVTFKDSLDKKNIETILHIQKEIWEHAKLGDPFSNYVLAHELGHIILHDSNAQPFSSSLDPRMKFLHADESAECQADLFADNFLVPDRIADAFLSAVEIAHACNVPLECAERRYRQRRIDRRLPAE